MKSLQERRQMANKMHGDFLRSAKKQTTRKLAKYDVRFKIDGVEYDSARTAAYKTGIPQDKIHEAIRGKRKRTISFMRRMEVDFELVK